MKEIMLAVSRTVSPWAIWLLPSSRSWTSRPSMLQAEAKEKRVRVELSRNNEMARPESKRRVEMFRSRRSRRASATANTPASSWPVLSQVRKKSFPYMFFRSSVSSSRIISSNCALMAYILLDSKRCWNKHSMSPAGINRYFVNNLTLPHLFRRTDCLLLYKSTANPAVRPFGGTAIKLPRGLGTARMRKPPCAMAFACFRGAALRA